MNRIIILLFTSFISISGFSQSATSLDKKHLKYIAKSEKLYEAKDYYNLYNTTKKALGAYPKDKWFNYLHSYALYYSRDHIEIRKTYKGTKLLRKVFRHLKKSKSLINGKKTNNRFSNDLQDEFYSKLQKRWDKNWFDKSNPILTFWFMHFDNSSDSYNNKYSETVQDNLFKLGTNLYKSGKEEKAIEVFNWMQRTFHKSNFKYKYDGSKGYINSEYSFDAYKNPLYLLANTAKDSNYLSPNEKQLIYLQNLVRMNPLLFLQTYVETFYKSNPYQSKSSYAKSLVEYLNKAEKSQLLYPSKALFDASEFHANDLGRLGGTGHKSSDGTSFGARLKRYGITGNLAENCEYSSDEPLRILMRLLIDQDVISLGHRKNIMSDTYSKVGVAIRTHKEYGYNTVLDYQN